MSPVNLAINNIYHQQAFSPLSYWIGIKFQICSLPRNLNIESKSHICHGQGQIMFGKSIKYGKLGQESDREKWQSE